MIPIIHLSDDTQIKTLMIQHGRGLELLDPKVQVPPGVGFRTHCVWAAGNQAFAVTRYQGYENAEDNGYMAIVVDISDKEMASKVINAFISANEDPGGPFYSFLEPIRTGVN